MHAHATLLGESPFDSAGESVAAAGDVDGDGRQDLLIGAPDASAASGAYQGAAYLVLGGVSGTHNLLTSQAKLLGEGEGAAGCSVAGAGGCGWRWREGSPHRGA